MITIQYGPWLPDIANLGFQIPDQQGPVEVPMADCLNVYYANGVYQSLPTAVAVAGSPALPGALVGQVATFLDESGNPIPFAATATQAYTWQAGAWNSVGFTSLSTQINWRFAQFGNQYYALGTPASIATGTSIPLYLITPAGANVPSLISGAPSGNVMAVVGQFLMIGDINRETYIPEIVKTIGTGNGSQTTFTGTLDPSNIPAAPTSIAIYNNGIRVGTDNGSGVLSGTGISTGTINYETGAVSVTFTTAPGVGIVIAAAGGIIFRTRLHWSPIGNPNPPGGWPTPLTNAALAVQSGINDLEYEYGPIMFIAGYPLYGVIFQNNAITRATYIGGNVVFSWQTFSRNLGLIARGAAVQVGPNTYFLSDQGFFYTDGSNVIPIGTAQDNSAGIDAWFWANINKAALSVIQAGYDGNKRLVFFSIPTGSNTLPDTLLCYNVVAGRWTRASQASEFIWSDTDGTYSANGTLINRLGLFQQSTHTYSLLTGTPNTGYLESLDMEFSDGMVRDTNGVRPNGNMTSPTVTVGTRNKLSQSITYNAGYPPDAFGAGFAPALTEGLYTRIRVSDTNATSIQGATCDMVPGGPL